MAGKIRYIVLLLLVIMASFALVKAAGILVTDLPIIDAYKKMINAMEKTSVITFEYGHDKNDERKL